MKIEQAPVTVIQLHRREPLERGKAQVDYMDSLINTNIILNKDYLTLHVGLEELDSNHKDLLIFLNLMEANYKGSGSMSKAVQKCTYDSH